MAHFDVGVGICEHLDSAISGAVVGAIPIDRITVIARRTLSSVDTEVTAVEKSILWADGHALVLHTAEGVIDIVVNRTGDIAYPD